MDNYATSGQSIFYVSLNLVTDFMCLLQANFPVKYQMKINIVVTPRAARPQFMKPSYLPRIPIKTVFDDRLLLWGKPSID